ncbi:MAG: TIM barrel protein [Bacillota bacterium]
MIAVSTSWFTRGAYTPEGVVRGLLELGADGVELDFRLGPEEFTALRRLVRQAGIPVTSLHNFCPVPDLAKKAEDPFLFTAADERERELALRYTLGTLERAAEVEAAAVVLHLGEVPGCASLADELYARHAAGAPDGEMEELRRQLAAARAVEGPKCLDRALLALDRVAGRAEKLGLKIGIENRYHFHEVPSPEEMDRILREFAGAPLGVWYDTGHAHHWEVMGWAAPGELLDRFAPSLVGVHLHDARGREDHRSPGMGEIDFAAVAAHLGPEILRVAEAHGKEDLATYREGLAHLRRLGF